MVAAASLARYADTHEQRLLLHDVTWKDYVLLRETLDAPGLRMTDGGCPQGTNPSPARDLRS